METSRESLGTDRLTLGPFSVELIRSLPERQAAEKLLGAALPSAWPDQELGELLEIYAKWATDRPETVGYGPWVVISRIEGTAVGSAGYQGLPAGDGSIELGFGIHPSYRNRGYATEAALALVGWALDQPSVKRVIANCEPRNIASIRVLEKVGLRRNQESVDNIRWELSHVSEESSAPSEAASARPTVPQRERPRGPRAKDGREGASG